MLLFVLAKRDPATAFSDLAVEFVNAEQGNARSDSLGAESEQAATKLGFGDEVCGDLVEGDLFVVVANGGVGFALGHGWLPSVFCDCTVEIDVWR